MLQLINMTFINNVSHENRNKITALVHFVNLFSFYTKIKTSILLRIGIEKPVQKNPPNKTWPQVFFLFVLIFYFFRYLKNFISIILIVIVLLNILPCNSRKTYVYTYISYE